MKSKSITIADSERAVESSLVSSSGASPNLNNESLHLNHDSTCIGNRIPPTEPRNTEQHLMGHELDHVYD